MPSRHQRARSAAVATVAAAAAAAALVGVAGLVSNNLDASTTGAGYGCPTGYGYGYATGYGYSSSTASATATPTSTGSTGYGYGYGYGAPSSTPTSTTGVPGVPVIPPIVIPPVGPITIPPIKLPAGSADRRQAAAAAAPAATSTACPTSTASSTGSSSSSSSSSSGATKSATPTPTPTPSKTTPGSTPTTPAAPGGPVVFPTFAAPFPTTTGPVVVKLSISKTFVTLGTHVTLSGTVTRGGVAVAGTPVAITETYSDGKVVPLGTFTTDGGGKFTHDDRPLYIGNITATALGTKSNTTPSRVILTYRKVSTSGSGGILNLTTSTRPGFVTGAKRQERVQLLLTDSHGRQKKVLALINAGARQNAPAEAQGINPIVFRNINLGHGTFYVVVKVLGTPVNTGAPSKPIKITL